MRFHVLGVGSIGTLLSHHLRLTHPHIPISLITKRASGFPSTRLYPYGQPGQKALKLSVERDGTVSESSGYELEVWHDGAAERYLNENRKIPERPTDVVQGPEEDAPNGKIKSLIVCLKTNATVNALSVLRPRLSPASVITLVQNGMGVFDELCASLWPDPATRPQFVMGTTTHGVTRGDQLGSVKHRTRSGEGEIKWGIVPDPRKEADFEQWLWGGQVGSLPILSAPASPPLPLPQPPATNTSLEPLHQTLEALLSLSYLSPTLLPMPHLHHQLLLKLGINSVINPLTAVIGAGAINNGALFGSVPSHRLIRLLCRETSTVLTAYLHSLSAPHSPEPDVLRLFSHESLESRVLSVVRSTAENTSSMAADVTHGRVTEVKHITGFLISLGKRLNVPTPSHAMIYDMVRFTSEINGLQPGLATYEKVSERRKSIQANIGSSYAPRSPRLAALEERKLELKEREIWLEEERLFEEIRQRRAKKASKRSTDWLERIKEVAPRDQVPTEKEWAALDRKERQIRLRSATGEEGGNSAAPKSASVSSSRSKIVTLSPSTTPVATAPSDAASLNFSPSVAKSSWMDAMIASAPRQERTWDLFASPPTARGPVPKKRATVEKGNRSEAAPLPSDLDSIASDSPPAQEKPTQPEENQKAQPSLSDMMSSMIGSVPRLEVNWDDPTGPVTLPSPKPKSSPRRIPTDPFYLSPTSPVSPLDALISSAPRAERSWEVKGGSVTGYTGSATSPRATPRQDLSRGGLGSSLDNLIGNAPRIERTWEAGPDRTGKRADGGRFVTSRTSGS